MIYAGIGSRETPEDILKLMKRIARQLERRGDLLRTGDADGADKAFRSGVEKPENKEVFSAKHGIREWTFLFTDHFHPAPKHLSPFARKLMNRNAMQILGRNGCEPVDFVVCWTKDGKASGGTGQAIRIAGYYNIPVFNLKNEGVSQALKEFVNGN